MINLNIRDLDAKMQHLVRDYPNDYQKETGSQDLCLYKPAIGNYGQQIFIPDIKIHRFDFDKARLQESADIEDFAFNFDEDWTRVDDNFVTNDGRLTCVLYDESQSHDATMIAVTVEGDEYYMKLGPATEDIWHEAYDYIIGQEV